MSTDTAKPTLAFLGPTGGCALAALSRSLENGYDCSALARTPSKLLTLLRSRGIPQGIVDLHLRIVEGNAKDAHAVKRLLAVEEASENARDIIICGVGGTPKFLPNPFRPTLDDPTICQTTTSTILSVLRSSYNTSQPLLVAISTTGIDHPRDFPLLMMPLYHWLLPVPHADKKVMEELIIGAKNDGVLGEYVIVKPGLLTDGIAKGVDAVRAGYEGRVKRGEGRGGDVEGVAVGYTVSREDVGGYVFEEIVVRGGGEWKGRKVRLVY